MTEVHRDLNTAFLEPDINLQAWIMSLQKLKKKKMQEPQVMATDRSNSQIQIVYMENSIFRH